MGDDDGYKEGEVDTVKEGRFDTEPVVEAVKNTERLREVVPDLVDD